MGYDDLIYYSPYEVKQIHWDQSLKFCWRPHRCFFSNKLLWFKKCYTGTIVARVDAHLISTSIYADKYEFLIAQLSNNGQ